MMRTMVLAGAALPLGTRLPSTPGRPWTQCPCQCSSTRCRHNQRQADAGGTEAARRPGSQLPSTSCAWSLRKRATAQLWAASTRMGRTCWMNGAWKKSRQSIQMQSVTPSHGATGKQRAQCLFSCALVGCTDMMQLVGCTFLITNGMH
jgi:hypothetical protein